MLLYLLRHAEAEVLASRDYERRLTDKGRVQAGRVGKFCRQHKIRPDVLLSSPVVRAAETAGLVASELGKIEPVEVPWAACGMDPWRAMEELQAYGKFASVMLVGHQPDLGGLAAALLGMGDVGKLHVRKALLIAIDVHGRPAPDAGALEFFLPVKLM
ncbi:MAG: phosphohistidine phosphatase SixA [Chthoniobacterales bacterium]|nr:phosphohistidine phosphatase SixA [Chthoniobacterales bacterium]